MRILIIIFLFITELVAFAQDKEISVKTEAEEVTVFLDGAQVTRRKVVDMPQGLSVLKFTDLSPYLDPKSIQFKVNGEVMILSVNHRFNYLDSAKRSEELEALNARLKELDNKIKLENVNIEIVVEELNFLKDNRVIGGKNQELSLNNFKQTSDFYKDRIAAAKLKLVELNSNIEKLSTEKAKIENQIRQITSNKPLPVSEIVAKINALSSGRNEVELSYFVKNAGWFPTYDIRSSSIDQPIVVAYKANVRQNTREEWKNVKLKLSSSDPHLGNIVPRLSTYYLNYNTPPPRYTNSNNQVSGQVLDAETNELLPGATVKIKGTTVATIADANGYYALSVPNANCELEASFVGYQSQTQRANSPHINFYLQPEVTTLEDVVVVGYGKGKGTAAGLSLSEPKVRKVKLQASSDNVVIPIEQTENMTSFEFEIKTPYTLLSDNKNLTVDIENYSMDAGYEYFCVPKIDKDAFLIANVTDWEKYNLLEGEANIYFENTFIGKSILDTRYISDTLNISLGRDKSVVVKREKIKDYTRKQFLGNKKEETRAWLIQVKNNKKQPIKINIFDQVPVSTNEEIEVIVEETSGGIIKNETGEVKWSLILAPQEKKDLVLRYRVKYPKQRILTIE